MIQNIASSPDPSSPACRSPRLDSRDPSAQKALDFATADYRWRVLSADPQQWAVPEKQRILAVAFLNYHAAKLALTVGDTD